MARLIDMSLSRLGAGHPAGRVGLAQWVVFGGGGGGRATKNSHVIWGKGFGSLGLGGLKSIT